MVLTKWLNSKLETKYRYDTLYSATGINTLGSDVKFNQAITGPSDCYTILPNVSQAVAEGGRIGQDIQPLSLVVKLGLSLVQPSKQVASAGIPLPGYGTDTAGPEDITVHIFFLKSKLFPDFLQVGNVNVANDLMCEYNGQAEQKFDGSYWSSRLMVNTNKYNVIKHLKIRMRKSGGYYSYVRTVNDLGNYDPESFPYNIGNTGANQVLSVNVRIPTPKTLTYKGNFDVQPIDYCPFMCAGWTVNDFPLAQPIATNFYPLAITGRVMLKYKDA